jgi:hypothetical protein
MRQHRKPKLGQIVRARYGYERCIGPSMHDLDVKRWENEGHARGGGTVVVIDGDMPSENERDELLLRFRHREDVPFGEWEDRRLEREGAIILVCPPSYTRDDTERLIRAIWAELDGYRVETRQRSLLVGGEVTIIAAAVSAGAAAAGVVPTALMITDRLRKRIARTNAEAAYKSRRHLIAGARERLRSDVLIATMPGHDFQERRKKAVALAKQFVTGRVEKDEARGGLIVQFIHEHDLDKPVDRARWAEALISPGGQVHFTKHNFIDL